MGTATVMNCENTKSRAVILSKSEGVLNHDRLVTTALRPNIRDSNKIDANVLDNFFSDEI